MEGNTVDDRIVAFKPPDTANKGGEHGEDSRSPGDNGRDRKPDQKHMNRKDISMKRVLVLTLLLTMSALPSAFAGQMAEAGTAGFGVSGGLMLPVSGDVATDTSFSDFFKAGPDFGAHVSYLPIKYLTVQAGFDYAFMKMKDEYRGDMVGEPYFTMPHVYLDGIWNMGALINSESNIVNPYLLAGGGLYFWKVTDDGAGGDAIVLDNGEELSKTSFGLRFGAGCEVYASPQISLFAEGKYHMVFTEDTDKFGEDFGNMGAISVKAGLTYHFPLGSTN